MSDTLTQKNRTLLAKLMLFAAGMVGLAYASVPLYRLFCQVTGFGGTPQIVTDAVAPGAVKSIPPFRVQFNADTNAELPWSFAPEQREVRVKAGEEVLIAYRATNNAAAPVSGTAVFNVTPPQAGAYFMKTQCFCFEKQTLQPGQAMDFPVLFFVDPAIADDPEAADIREITLSYTFYPSDKAPLEQTAQ
jgi:cytochrome c oxidase assembly protein subunit 11